MEILWTLFSVTAVIITSTLIDLAYAKVWSKNPYNQVKWVADNFTGIPWPDDRGRLFVKVLKCAVRHLAKKFE